MDKQAIARDLTRHLSDEMQDAIFRHLALGNGAMEPVDLLAMPLQAGTEASCAGIASVVATILMARPGEATESEAREIIGALILRACDLMRGAEGMLVEKVMRGLAAARAAAGART